MQTFLPFASFTHSVVVLDRARLGKQRVECGQILTVLRVFDGKPAGGWTAHPAVKMWAGYEAALGAYMTLCCWEWQARGYAQNMATPYERDFLRNPVYHGWSLMTEEMRQASLPPWLGREELHASHRARLLHKDPEYYGQFGWTETPRTDEEGYWWPV
jgi:hypothetical protein